MFPQNVEAYRQDDGSMAAYAWPGMYPLYYVTEDGGVLCPACVNKELNVKPEALTVDPEDPQWKVVGVDANWEDEELTCAHCNQHIESAYGKD